MTNEKKQELILYAYNDALSLHDEGMTIEELEQVIILYEEKELYLHCAGIKKAINKLKQSDE